MDQKNCLTKWECDRGNKGYIMDYNRSGRIQSQTSQSIALNFMMVGNFISDFLFKNKIYKDREMRKKA